MINVKEDDIILFHILERELDRLFGKIRRLTKSRSAGEDPPASHGLIFNLHSSSHPSSCERFCKTVAIASWALFTFSDVWWMWLKLDFEKSSVKYLSKFEKLDLALSKTQRSIPREIHLIFSKPMHFVWSDDDDREHQKAECFSIGLKFIFERRSQQQLLIIFFGTFPKVADFQRVGYFLQHFRFFFFFLKWM